MTRYQLLLLPTLAAAILGLGGALSQKPDTAQSAPAIGPSTANSPEALAILDQAIDAVDPDRVPWMEIKVWRQVRCDDFSYQASGRMVTAPGDKCASTSMLW